MLTAVPVGENSWDDSATGTLIGISSYTTREHIARATLEATCFQTKAILDAMEKDSGQALTELAVDGGMSNSDLIMQASGRRRRRRVALAPDGDRGRPRG